MIQNIIFGILFLKILFRAYNVFMFVHTFHWTSSEFFLIFRFSRRKSPFWLCKFSSKYDSVWCHKNICTVPFLVSQEPNSWSFLKANAFVFLYISVKENFCSKDVVRFYLMGMGWGRLNSFLKAACCLDLVKCFTIFHFNWIFLKFNYFSGFW